MIDISRSQAKSQLLSIWVGEYGLGNRFDTVAFSVRIAVVADAHKSKREVVQ